MSCCTGSKIEYEDLMPKEIQDLRKGAANWIMGNIGQGATPLPEGFPISALVNPASNSAMNIIMGMMGQGGYIPPPMMNYNYGTPGAQNVPGLTPPWMPRQKIPGEQGSGRKLPLGFDMYDPTRDPGRDPEQDWQI